MNLFLEVIFFVLGLCLGSFINMAVWRIGHQKSLLKNQRSFCDFCKKQLKWYDNIPIFSWLICKGKSRCCGKKLSILYPITELIMGILMSLNYFFFKDNLDLLLVNLLISILLIFEADFDFRYLMLPDLSAYLLIGLAVVKWILIGMPISFLIYAVLSALFIFILHKIKIRGQEAMGDGDIFLAFFMGLFLGFPQIMIAFYVAFISGAVIGVGLIISKKMKRSKAIPFGPFLVFGTIIAFYWGEKIIRILNL